MIILGIDPGTRRIGYGIIRLHASVSELVAVGILKIESKDDPGALKETKRELDALIKKYKPDLMAVERLYFMKNLKTGIQVAQARGVILLCAAERGLEIREYTPNEVKYGIAGYGAADKKAVAKMVRMILKNPLPGVIDDATDALAIALLAAQSLKLSPKKKLGS